MVFSFAVADGMAGYHARPMRSRSSTAGHQVRSSRIWQARISAPLYITTYSNEYSARVGTGKGLPMTIRATLNGIRCLLVRAALVLVASSLSLAAHAQGRDLLVFGAASLKNALDDANAQFQRDTGHKVVVSYGASSALATQIEGG